MSLPLGTRVDTLNGHGTVFKVDHYGHWVKVDFANYVNTFDEVDLTVLDEPLDWGCVRILNPTATQD